MGTEPSLEVNQERKGVPGRNRSGEERCSGNHTEHDGEGQGHVATEGAQVAIIGGLSRQVTLDIISK